MPCEVPHAVTTFEELSVELIYQPTNVYPVVAVTVSVVVAPCLTDDEPTDTVPPTPFVHVSVAVVALLAALPTANACTV